MYVPWFDSLPAFINLHPAFRPRLDRCNLSQAHQSTPPRSLWSRRQNHSSWPLVIVLRTFSSPRHHSNGYLSYHTGRPNERQREAKIPHPTNERKLNCIELERNTVVQAKDIQFPESELIEKVWQNVFWEFLDHLIAA